MKGIIDSIIQRESVWPVGYDDSVIVAIPVAWLLLYY
jgi:hypothetical protein